MDRLKKILKKLGRVAVAFSGGVDSTFLLKVAKDTLGRGNVLAVTASSETYPSRELKEARRLAKAIGVRHIVIRTREFNDPEFRRNPPRRCYYCKKELFGCIKKLIAGKRFRYIADAANYDDRKDFRPGILAAKEEGVVSPLKEARFTKGKIRKLSKKFGLPTWDKPPYACLASRIPYYETITERKLRMIEEAEDILRRRFGFGQVRVRCHGDIARIEVRPEEIGKFFKGAASAEIAGRFRRLGFEYVTVDLQGYRTGSMNETKRRR